MFLVKSDLGYRHRLIRALGGSRGGLPVRYCGVSLFDDLLGKSIPLLARWAFTQPFRRLKAAALAEIGYFSFSQCFDA